MADLFDKAGIQASDINPDNSPGISALGQPTGTPSGKISSNVTADLPKASASTGQEEVPATGTDDQGNPLQSDNGDLQDMGSNNTDNPPDINTLTPPAELQALTTEPPEDRSAKPDLFDKYEINTPSIQAQNNAALNTGVDVSDPNAPEDVKSYVDNNQTQMQQLAKTRFSDSEIDEMKKNPMSWVDGFNMVRSDQIIPFGGLNIAYNALDIVHLEKKQAAGESLSDSENAKINDFLDRQVEMNTRGFTWGGKIAYIAPQIPAFVAEYGIAGLITGGGSDVAAASAEIAAEGATRTAVSVAASKVAEVGTRSAFMPAQYTARYGELRLNDNAAITDKGQLVLKDNEESPAITALKAFAYTNADVAGQVAAPYLGKYIINPATKAVSTPLISAVNNLPGMTKAALYDAYKTIQPNAQVSKAFTALGWSGMLEQLGANRVSEILKATTDLGLDKEYTTDDYLNAITPSKDQLMVEGGLISIAGGIHTATNVAANLMTAKGMDPATANKTVANMSAVEKENFVQDNLITPKSGYINAEDLEEKGQTNVIKISDKDINQPGNSLDNALNTIRTGQTPQFSLGDPTGSKYKNYTPLDEEGKSYIQATIDTLNQSFSGNLHFSDSNDGEVGSSNVVGFKSNTPAWFQDLNKEGGGYTKDYISGVADKMQASEPLGTKEAKVAEVLFSQAQDMREENIRGLQQRLDEHGLDITAHTNDEIRDTLNEIDMQDAAAGVPVENRRPNPQADALKYMMHLAEAQNPPPVQDKESGFNKTYRATLPELKSPTVKPKINDSEGIGSRLYREVVNDVEPITKLSKMMRDKGEPLKDMEDPLLLVSNYRNIGTMRDFYIQVSPFRYNEKGNVEYYGKSLKAIHDDFDNMMLRHESDLDQRHQDFGDYLRATRYLRDLQERFASKIDKKIDESNATMLRLAEKYGEDFHMIEPLAQEVREYNHHLLDLPVEAGVMKREDADQLIKDHPNYIPLNKIMDEAEKSYLGGKGLHNARIKELIKRMKGSELEDKDPFHSMIINTHKAIELAARNRIAQSVANFSTIAPELVQRVMPNIIKKGTTETKVSFDPTLRKKLETAIEQLGGQIERSKSIKVPGYKNVLGSYSPTEKMIRLRLGSTEGTMTHELGHMLDFSLGLKEKMLKDPTVKRELRDLAESRLGSDLELVKNEKGETVFNEKNQQATDKYLNYIKNDREILANFYDAYVNSPDLAREMAPTAIKSFEKILAQNPELSFLKDIRPSTARDMEILPTDLFGEDPRAPDKTITVFKNGEKQYYRVAKPMLAAMKSLSPREVSMVEKILLAPTKAARNILQWGATHTPQFAVRHIIKDVANASVLSGTGVNPMDFKQGLFDRINKKGVYNDWVASGGKSGSYRSLTDDGKDMQKAHQELFNPDGKIMRYIKNPFHFVEDTTRLGLESSRLAVFRAAKREGSSDLRAANIAKDLENYGRGGRVSKFLNNNFIPFTNIAIQGTDKIVRMLKDPVTRPAALMKAIGILTIPALLRSGYYLYGAPDDIKKKYLEINDGMKAINSYFLWHGDDGSVKIADLPNPFNVGYEFAGVPERMMLWMYNGDKPEGQDMYKDILTGMFGELAPIHNVGGILPVPLKIYLENQLNHNFFTDKPLFPEWLADPKYDKEPEKRANIGDSETAMMLGKSLSLSPAKIDNTVRELSGNTGMHLMKASDLIIDHIREWNGGKNNEKPIQNSDIPLLQGFLPNPPTGYRSNSFQAFQTAFKEVNATVQKAKDLDGQDKADYISKNKDIMSLHGEFNSVKKEISSLGKQSRNIYDNANMTGEQKGIEIEKINEKITEIAREANLRYNQVKEKSK